MNLSLCVREAAWPVDSQGILALRRRVFIEEQQVPEELELDGLDSNCVLVVAEDRDGLIRGSGRMLPNGHIGRMAIDRELRGQGLGSRILIALLAAARSRGFAEVKLDAQEHALGFYERHGFRAEGEAFQEAGIRHRHMKRRV